MKQIYYAIQSTLHGRGSNVTKVISLSLGLTIGVLLFSQIAFELNYEKCYPDADRLVLVRIHVWPSCGVLKLLFGDSNGQSDYYY